MLEWRLHSLMLSERQQARRLDPERAARHAQHVAQAEAALVESQRRNKAPKPEKYHTGRSGRPGQNPYLFRELSDNESYVVLLLRESGHPVSHPGFAARSH